MPITQIQPFNLNNAASYTLGNLDVSGVVTAIGNVTAAYFIGNGSQLAGVTATGIGVLPSLSVTGNAQVGNLLTNGLISATSTVTSAANIAGGNILTVGLVSATGNVTGNYLFGNGSQITGLPAGYANSDVANYLASGSDTQAIITTGNITGGNVLTGGLISVTGTITSTANITGGNLLTGGLISSTGTVTGSSLLGSVVSVSANITGGNLLTGGLVSATGTVTGSSLLGSVVSVSGNITGGNLLTSGAASATGNLTVGNVLTGGLISATGTITSTANITGGNVLTGGLISATGNITGGNVNTAVVRNNSGALTISTGSSSINLNPTGNIVVNSTYINSVADPVQSQDVATKNYVDTIASTGIAYHQAVLAATTTTLATTTGGTITYTQPNGAGNGVGATITTTGSFNLIDTANVQTANTRILVKNEANAVLNGVYYWANASTIIRTTDTDEYGPASAEQLSINDYFFVQSGNVNAGSSYIVDSPTGTITFGTSNIVFAQFSSSQTYTANTSAGISLNGTVINAKVDNISTSFDGTGNIVVKPSATLTTPNIGAATGTSVSVTGTVTAASTVGGVITGSSASVTGTVTAASTVGGVITGSSASVTGTVTAASTVGGVITGTSLSVSGNVTGSYILGNGSQLTGITSTTITNDTSTNTTYYPTMAGATSGSLATAYTSDTKLTFNPSTGDLGATNFNSLSDESKKTDIETIVEAVEMLMHLRGVFFRWKDNGRRSMGMIAQEVERVIPEIVSTAEDGTKSIAYGSVIGLLVEVVKDHEIRLQQLEARA